MTICWRGASPAAKVKRNDPDATLAELRGKCEPPEADQLLCERANVKGNAD